MKKNYLMAPWLCKLSFLTKKYWIVPDNEQSCLILFPLIHSEGGKDRCDRYALFLGGTNYNNHEPINTKVSWLWLLHTIISSAGHAWLLPRDPVFCHEPQSWPMRAWDKRSWPIRGGPGGKIIVTTSQQGTGFLWWCCCGHEEFHVASCGVHILVKCLWLEIW